MKLATTPARATRKPKVASTPKAVATPRGEGTSRAASTSKAEVVTEAETPKGLKRKAATPAATPSGSSDKSKRNRTLTQHYQSPLPELEMITKITKSTSTPRAKSAGEKLVVFYK